MRKCYDSRAKFNHCWASQKFTLNKQGFGYIPKKGKKAFVQTKTIFVKSSGKSYCEKCKKVGHVEKNCTNKKVISFDSSYILMKNSNGNVSAKFVGIPIDGAKKNAIWVPKVLVTNVVTNVQRPKKVWVHKRVTSFLSVNYKSGGRHWVLDSGCTQHMTGDQMMFSSLDENVVGYSDIIFGDNSRGKVKGVGTIPISSDHSLSKVLLVDYLKFNLLVVLEFISLCLLS